MRRVLLIVGLAVILVLPFRLTDFETFQLTQVMIYAIAILGLNLLTGFNGQFSLGHSAFFAIGAYTAAIMMEYGHVPYVWTLPVAGLLGFVAGFLFGLPALRLEGLYLALATFALAVATPQLFKLSPIEHWTGGVMGITLSKPDAPFGLPLSADQWLYLFTATVGLLMYAAARNLVHSRSGRAIMAIRDNPIAARTMGINTALVKALTFGVSALYTAVAGALSAIVVAFVSPDSFTFSLAIGLLVGLVVGGVGWLPGALFGGAFVLYVPTIAQRLALDLSGPVLGSTFVLLSPELAERISRGLSGAVYGVILILLIYVMPSGAAGLFRRKAAAPERNRGNPQLEKPQPETRGGSDELETVSPASAHGCEPRRPRRPAVGTGDRAEEVPGRHG